MGWWDRVCYTYYHLVFTEYEAQGFSHYLSLGAGVAGAIPAVCPPCIPVAGAIAAGLTVTAALVAYIDWLGGNKGIYADGWYWGVGYIWHN